MSLAEYPPAYAGGSPGYDQLTHDYLVPSLREWLIRKQASKKETRRGRAEFKLEERSALWNAKPENRHLPSLTEWLSIRSLTESNHWTAAQRFHSACALAACDPPLSTPHAASEAAPGEPHAEREEYNYCRSFAILDASDVFLMGSPVSETKRYQGPTGKKMSWFSVIGCLVRRGLDSTRKTGRWPVAFQTLALLNSGLVQSGTCKLAAKGNKCLPIASKDPES